jgi:hypothetical protein
VIVVGGDDQISIREPNGVPSEYVAAPLALNPNARWILLLSASIGSISFCLQADVGSLTSGRPIALLPCVSLDL